MSRIEIIPAILVNGFAELSADVELMKGFVKTVQIDACDGRFVPNATWPYRKHDENFERIVGEQDGMPGWKELNFEIDLMADDPQDKVEPWVQAGASRVILHAEAKGDIAGAIASLAGRIEVGIAFDMSTDLRASLSALRASGAEISSIQLMGIDNVGFQHQPFDEKVVGRVREARLEFPELPIAVDGGVSLETAPALIAAGADRLVVGSAIFAAENPIDAIAAFKRLTK